jgi:hypothetical protein
MSSHPTSSSPVERARAYIQRLEPAISGSGGHNATFRAASILVEGFALDEATALDLLLEWNLTHCSPQWSERELQHKVRSAARNPSAQRGHLLGSTPSGHITRPPDPYTAPRQQPAPQPEPEPRSVPFNSVLAARIGALCTVEQPDHAWLRSISPIDVSPGAWSHQTFFSALYPEGEVILIFTSPYSQGDFAWWSGYGPVVMSPDTKTRSQPSALPRGSKDGIWFLANPVDGQWHPKPGKIRDTSDMKTLTRRSESCVTTWRYLVLESDDLSTADWLRIVAQIPMPIAAIYTSGGRSIHTLIRVNAPTKAHFDNLRDMLRKIYAPLGADPAAMTAVRLTRLPGMLRGTRMQELLYLDPQPHGEELQTRKPIR